MWCVCVWQTWASVGMCGTNGIGPQPPVLGYPRLVWSSDISLPFEKGRKAIILHCQVILKQYLKWRWLKGHTLSAY